MSYIEDDLIYEDDSLFQDELEQAALDIEADMAEYPGLFDDD